MPIYRFSNITSFSPAGPANISTLLFNFAIASCQQRIRIQQGIQVLLQQVHEVNTREAEKVRLLEQYAAERRARIESTLRRRQDEEMWVVHQSIEHEQRMFLQMREAFLAWALQTRASRSTSINTNSKAPKKEEEQEQEQE